MNGKNFKWSKALKPNSDKTKHSKWHFLKRLEWVFDLIMFLLAIAAAMTLAAYNKTRLADGQSQFVHFSQPKNKAKKTKIPKSKIAKGDAYQLVPKKKVKRYRTVFDIYGNQYKQKLKHPKAKYLAHFYLDPNYASKDQPIKKDLYVLLNGCVVPTFKNPQNGQYNFLNSSLAYNSTQHYVLNDSQTYIKVMQFKSFNKYGQNMVPNANNNTLNLTINEGPSRYLKLSEFKIKRVKNMNLSNLAEQAHLFSGYDKSIS